MADPRTPPQPPVPYQPVRRTNTPPMFAAADPAALSAEPDPSALFREQALNMYVSLRTHVDRLDVAIDQLGGDTRKAYTWAATTVGEIKATVAEMRSEMDASRESLKSADTVASALSGKHWAEVALRSNDMAGAIKALQKGATPRWQTMLFHVVVGGSILVAVVLQYLAGQAQ